MAEIAVSGRADRGSAVAFSQLGEVVGGKAAGLLCPEVWIDGGKESRHRSAHSQLLKKQSTIQIVHSDLHILRPLARAEMFLRNSTPLTSSGKHQ